MIAVNERKALLKFYGQAKKGYILTPTNSNATAPNPSPYHSNERDLASHHYPPPLSSL